MYLAVALPAVVCFFDTNSVRGLVRMFTLLWFLIRGHTAAAAPVSGFWVWLSFGIGFGFIILKLFVVGSIVFVHWVVGLVGWWVSLVSVRHCSLLSEISTGGQYLISLLGLLGLPLQANWDKHTHTHTHAHTQPSPSHLNVEQRVLHRHTIIVYCCNTRMKLLRRLLTPQPRCVCKSS